MTVALAALLLALAWVLLGIGWASARRRRRIADVVRAAREVAAATSVEQAAAAGARLARRVTAAEAATVVLGGRVVGGDGREEGTRPPTSTHAIRNRFGPPGELVLVGVPRPVDRATRQLVTSLAELIGETTDRVVSTDPGARGAAWAEHRIEPSDAVVLVEVRTLDADVRLDALVGLLREALRPTDQVVVENGTVLVVARDARPSTDRVQKRIVDGWVASGEPGRLVVRDASAPRLAVAGSSTHRETLDVHRGR